MSDTPARLIIQKGRYQNQEFELVHLQTTIGRSPSNDIAFMDPEISRRHAQVINDGNGYAVEDLGSTNGTFVNHQRISKVTPVKHGDIINLGDAIDLRFFNPPPQLAETPVPELEPEQTAVSSPPVNLNFPPPRSTTTPGPHRLPNTSPLETTDSGIGETLYSNPLLVERGNRRLKIIGFSILVILGLCIGLILFLDSYQQGQLLYCGSLGSFFETILGPIGFSPTCP